MTPRRRNLLIGLGVLGSLAGLGLWRVVRFPPDTTPEGAYMRIARAIREDEPTEAFAYLEQEAQHASFTIVGYARKATARIEASYPEPDRSEALTRYAPLASPANGPELFASLAAERGWLSRLRRDLSGVAEVTIEGERATVVTARGTRYPFRRRPNGIWGLTIFTPELTQLAEHLARDWELIQNAAEDYQRTKPSPEEG